MDLLKTLGISVFAIGCWLAAGLYVAGCQVVMINGKACLVCPDGFIQCPLL